ncbi:MAG: tRNA 2-selenouridine(34) synthase MnmH [Betaproteobacteria bacterium RIFCSPLOWO2_12_FULL_66_14]|nr:MAG: tRNA 2-selenouridine(34) synthase MnmH [Betaproteobacteria bacterium RIFCSPLOWO2_12_FULL_66_14]
MKFPNVVTVAQLAEFDEVIDVRSPSEFAEDHVPGAINCPVLDDAERAAIGTMYKQVSPFDANKRGAALVAKNIARHIEETFAAHGRGWRPLVYCWRGGKRSGAMAHILSEIGWHAAQLDGGYRAYRREILAQLAELPPKFRYRVVCGATGSAKSRLLQALASAGAQVLDLEDLASHRGSVLGNLPEQAQPAQKMFDSLVWDALRKFDPDQVIYVEAESKKIGQLQVPDALLARMRASPCVLIEAPLAERVGFLLQEYGHFLGDPQDLKAKLDCLAGLHSKDTIARWTGQVERALWRELVADLLENHYDPAYRRATSKNFEHLAEAQVLKPARLDAASLAQMAEELIAATHA